MAVPTIIARDDLEAGSGQQATPAAFGAQSAAALARLGNSIQRGGQAAVDFFKIRETRKAQAAVREGDQKLYSSTLKFMEENKDAVDLDEQFEKEFNRMEGEVAAEMPDGQALEAFKRRAAGIRRSFEARAVSRAGQNVERQAVRVTMEGARFDGNSFRETFNDDKEGSIARLTDRFQEELATVADNYSEDPEFRDSLSNELTKEYFFSALAKDPATAQHILNSSTTLPARERDQLQQKIDSGVDNFDQEARFALTEDMPNRIAMAEQGQEEFLHAEDIPTEEDWQAQFGQQKGTFLFNRAQEDLGRARMVARVTESWKGLSPAAIQQEIATLQTDDRTLSAALRRKALEMQAQHDNDPLVTVMENPVFQAAAAEEGWAGFEDGPMPSTLVDRALQFQGDAPPGTPDNLKGYYLRRARQDQTILTNAQKAQLAPRVESAFLADVDRGLALVAELWPDPRHREEAIIDLGSDMAPAINILMASYDGKKVPEFAKDFIAAQKNLKANENESKDKLDQLNTAFANHPDITVFRNSFIGDFGEDATKAAGMSNAIRAYAVALTRNREPDEAVQLAAEDLLKNFRIVEANQGGIMLEGKREVVVNGEATKREWTPRELSNIRRGMNTAMDRLANSLTTEGLDLENQEGLQELVLTGDRLFANERLSKQIRDRGLWRPTKDGLGVVLNLRDARGNGVPLFKRNQNGQREEIRIDLTDLSGGQLGGLRGDFDVTETPVNNRRGDLHRSTINVFKLNPAEIDAPTRRVTDRRGI